MSKLYRLMSSLENPPESIESAKSTMFTTHGSSNDDPGAKAQRIKTQTENFRSRINADARAMLKGRWSEVKKPYKPKEVKDEKSQQWRAEVQRQEKMNAWNAAAQKPVKNGSLEESRYKVIMEMRNDSGFVGIAKKIPQPDKPASMNKPPEPAPTPSLATITGPISLPVSFPVKLPAPQAVSPTNLKRKAAGDITKFKQEIVNVDRDDEEPEQEPEVESDYEPEDEATIKRERRADKRQRTGDIAPRPKRSTSEEDLDFQLEELKLKSQLQQVQLRRKMAALKRRKEDDNVK